MQTNKNKQINYKQPGTKNKNNKLTLKCLYCVETMYFQEQMYLNLLKNVEIS